MAIDSVTSVPLYACRRQLFSVARYDLHKSDSSLISQGHRKWRMHAKRRIKATFTAHELNCSSRSHWNTCFENWLSTSRPSFAAASQYEVVIYSRDADARYHWTHGAQCTLASTRPGMPGTHPPNILVGGEVNGNIPPPILLRTFGYSRSILVSLRSLSLKPMSFGYKTPPIRFSQAGGQSAYKALPPNLELALTPLHLSPQYWQ